MYENTENLPGDVMRITCAIKWRHRVHDYANRRALYVYTVDITQCHSVGIRNDSLLWVNPAMTITLETMPIHQVTESH